MNQDIERLIAERKKSLGLNGSARSERRRSKKGTSWSQFRFSRGVTSQDRTVFLSQLSLMLRARVSLVRSLEILIDQTHSSKMKSVAADVLKEVKKGSVILGVAVTSSRGI